MFKRPSIQNQSADSVACYVLKPYDSFCNMATTISESTKKYTRVNLILVSFSINTFSRLANNAPFISNLTIDILLMGATRHLAATKHEEKCPFCSSHLMYAHVPYALIYSSLNRIKIGGLSVAFGGFVHLSNFIFSMINISLKKLHHSLCNSS